MKKILFATENRGKLDEVLPLLCLPSLSIISTDSFSKKLDVEETGKTFEENAQIKAQAYYETFGLPTFADDSGLVVDALGGRPGIYSSRYGGKNLPFKEKIVMLLEELKDVPQEKRTARFVSVIVYIDEKKKMTTFEGICDGRIDFQPKGHNGFGYDPIFYLPSLQKNMGELSLEEKNHISHRAQAIKKFREFLIKSMP